MALITFTSDLGAHDYHAAVKGAIITLCPDAQIVDVTQTIRPFNIKEAAFVVRNAYGYFPKGSIHLVHVNAAEGNNKLLLAQVNNHYFLTFDNGLLSLIFEKTPHQTYQINEELTEGSNLLFEQAIARVIELLLKEYQPTDFAQLITHMQQYRLLQPAVAKGNIRGTVAYIDRFGNAITNITQKMFDENIGGNGFRLLTNSASVKVLHQSYADVEEGEVVCFFNSANLLEVAINKGKADKLLGMKPDVSVVLITAE